MRELLIIVFAVLLLSCNDNGKIESKIETYISNNCDQENCVIDLTEVLSFKWKHFYVFKETASLELVEQVLRQKYPYFNDVARRLVFTDESNNIIYHEDIFPDFEGVTNNSVIFSMPDTVNYKLYKQFEFTVKKEEIKSGYYYVLY